MLQFRQSLAASFRLVLEVTERSLVDDTALASENLNVLRQHGCQVAVDDFGTGYCSLSLLHNLPVDYLKIDKIFIDTLTSAGTDTPVLDTIIGLSKRLGLATIAEGVSTQQQAEWLKDNRVSYVQGIFMPDRCRQLISFPGTKKITESVRLAVHNTDCDTPPLMVDVYQRYTA